MSDEARRDAVNAAANHGQDIHRRKKSPFAPIEDAIAAIRAAR